MRAARCRSPLPFGLRVRCVVAERVVFAFGSRDFADRALVARVLRWFRPAAVWSGGCRGADALAAAWAAAACLPVRVFRADWARLGRAAGPLRSRALVAELPAGRSVGVCFASCPRPPAGARLSSVLSRGSAAAVAACLAASVPVFVVFPGGCVCRVG